MLRVKIKSVEVLLSAVLAAALMLAVVFALQIAPKAAGAAEVIDTALAAEIGGTAQTAEKSDEAKVKTFLLQERNGKTNAEILGIKDLEDKAKWKPYAVFAGDSLVEINITKLKDDKAVYGPFDLSGCASLKEFVCTDNLLAQLKLSGCAALETLDCRRNQLTVLDVSDCAALTELNCAQNKLTALNVSAFPFLEKLYCGGNQFAILDLSANAALKELYCSGNKLTSLKISGCADLESVYCYNNNLKTLALTGCKALKSLGAHRNSFTNQALTGLKALNFEYLSYTDNGDGFTYCVIRDGSSVRTLTVKCIGEGFVIGQIIEETVELYINPGDGYEFVEWQDAEVFTFEWKTGYCQAGFDGDDLSITAVFGRVKADGPAAVIVGAAAIASICAAEIAIFAVFKLASKRNSRVKA